MSYYCRKFLILICIFQFIATLEWQVFNFLGYMWTPIIICFLHLLFILVGFFGALQYRPRCAVVYVIWLFLWLGVNVFVICIYLQVGILRKDSVILNLGLGNKSWWFDHGIGCLVNASHPAYTGVRGPSSVIPHEREVTGCLLAYTLVETIHAGVQILLSVLGIVAAICLAHLLRNEEDTYVAAMRSARTAQPVKSSEMEYINMRRSSGHKPAPLLVPSPQADFSQPSPTPPPSHFDTLVTEVDTLSPHHSHDSIPPNPLSANRLLRSNPEPPAAAAASPRPRSQRRPRRSRQQPDDTASALSRESASTRGRQPLPWVSAAVLPPEEESLPPPYSAQPLSRWDEGGPPSPALYRPPARGHSPYENWPMPAPGRARYENSWSPVPPASSASGRGGVIFFRSTGGEEGGEGNGHSFGGSVMV